jgi:hypothetical protein
MSRHNLRQSNLFQKLMRLYQEFDTNIHYLENLPHKLAMHRLNHHKFWFGHWHSIFAHNKHVLL